MKTELFIEVLKELRKHKIGLIGLALLLIEIGMVVFYPLVANPADVDNWYNLEYWKYRRMTPRLAPPIWVNLFDPNAPPPSTDLEFYKDIKVFDFRRYEDFKSYFMLRNPNFMQTLNITPEQAESVMYQIWQEEKERIGKVVIIKLIYYYKFTANRAPLDVAFRLRFNFGNILYSNESYWRQGFGIYVHRPDGIKLSLLPNQKYPTNPYDVNQYADIRNTELLRALGIPYTVKNGTMIFPKDQDWFISLKTLTSSSIALGEMALQDILRPLLEEARETVRVGELIDLPTVIFSKAAPGITSGKSGPLHGTYMFEFVFFLRIKPKDINEPADVESVRAMALGTYGLLGTDDKGRDLWSAMVYGIRWALFLGVVVATFNTILGALYGTISAYFGGKVDVIMQQIARVYVSIPAFPLLIMLSSFIGRSIWLLMFFLIVFGWIGGQFTVRSMVLQIREQTYVEAARALGASNRRILLRYVFPQVLPYLFAVIALGVPGVILTEAGLSFIGLGDPVLVTWGKILYEAGEGGALSKGAWWWVIPPGIAITITAVAFIMFGQAIEKIIEPRLKKA